MATFRMLLLIYRRNMRVQPVRELFAVLAVAAGVAMLFAVQVANGSITEAFEATAHAVAGRAKIEVAARGPEGFDERTVYRQVTQTAGVVRAAPLLQQEIAIDGPAGSSSATLVGADQRLVALGGRLVGAFWRDTKTYKRGVLLVGETLAKGVGARAGQLVTVELNGLALRLFLARPVTSTALDSLSTQVAGLPLTVAQRLAGLPGRATRILVQPAAGQTAKVEAALRRRLGATLNVRPVGSEPQMLAQAARPESEIAALFALISVVVGAVLAFNALLLSSRERRTMVIHLSRLGARDRLIVASLLFDALLIGAAGCVIGLAAGDLLSLLVYHSVPGYLSAAFPLSEQRVISSSTIGVSVAAGMLAALAAAAFPAMRVLRESGVVAASRGGVLGLARSQRLRLWMLVVGMLLLAGSALAALLWPAATVGAVVGALAGLLLCTPAAVALLLRLARGVSQRVRDPAACLAAAELQSDPVRSLALAATGMIALFVIVTIGGAVWNIETAVSRGAAGVVGDASVWVNPSAATNVYSTDSLRSSALQGTLERLPNVERVLPYRESFLDWNGERVWVIAAPPAAREPVAASQMIDGTIASADARLRSRGWAVVSQRLASREHIHIGSAFSLPTPTGFMRLRLAATVSNYGWLEGSVLLSEADYRAYWHTSRVSALGVVLRPGANAAYAEQLVRGALPRDAALSVETARQRQELITRVLASTLARLRGTVSAVLLAALASVIAMMIAAVWARRQRIDGLIAMGTSSRQLIRLVCYETGTVMIAGCLVGLASGVVGQALIDRWLRASTGSPVRFAAAWEAGVRTLLIACAIVVLASVLTVLRTVRIPARAAFSSG